MAVYTKKGDRGKTKIFGCKQVISKSSLIISAIGSIDELNSYLGVTLSYCENPETSKFIKEIQKDLFVINSILAGTDLRFYKTKTTYLEKKIDLLGTQLPKLTNFIFPRGSRLASHLMYARALARKAERETVALCQIENVKPEVLKYLNRLSDTLFMLSREANWDLNVKEEVWKADNR